tara:strand:+ start:669 stop:1139 length:471 start_codon:yes stop_codon:yes gene_type:complete
MNTEIKQGGCQCGKVAYELSGAPVALYRCHCTECQTASGGAFGMSMWVRMEDFKLNSGALKKYVRVADSGGEVESFFCENCGVRIYTRPLQLDSGFLVLKPGTLKESDNLKPSADIWLGSKQKWFEPSEDTRHFDGQPLVEALFESHQELDSTVSD